MSNEQNSTKLLKKEQINDATIIEIAAALKDGKLVIFPTDTVYGIGTNGLDENAVKKLFEIKKRNRKNPINLLVNSISMVENIAKDITPLEYKLMEEFFPRTFYNYFK